MNYMKMGIAIWMVAIPVLLSAQTETFDIVTYHAPAGWKKQSTQSATSFSIVDNTLGTWCQVGIYNSVQSGGNASNDFASEWKALVKSDTYAGAVEPTPRPTVNDGWTYNLGSSSFKWQGKDSFIMLLNVSGYGVMLSIIISGNTDKYNADIDALIKSLRFKKPVQQSQPAQQAVAQQQASQQPATQQQTSQQPIVITGAPGNSGISISTTNFDDGWVAQPFAEYVKISKGSLTVLLHYAVQIDDNMRTFDNMATPFWDRLITPRYRTSNVKVFQNEPYTYFKVYFMEADAVELSSNRQCHVALRVLVGSGIAMPIEIIAPSAVALQNEFPDQKKIESMPNYNKFAVSAGDLVGTWQESSSTGINMYNSVTGAYAGMNASASASTFEIHADGTYKSEHKGAYGMVGSMKAYDQKYEGKYTLTPWDVTMTNRFEGKTDVYWCQFEAVRGGRVLHLADKSASAMTYSLVKVK